jgi:hypothetical protein
MSKQIRIFFLLLVLIQGVHSVEEYMGKIWEVFAPAKFLCGLISKNHETGFLIINTGLFIFGMWCWFGPLRKNNALASGFIWFWIVIELINGIGHPLWALREWAYVPGLITAPFLLVLAICLLRHQIRADN